jgi:Protein of unknown function (DUF2854)
MLDYIKRNLYLKYSMFGKIPLSSLGLTIGGILTIVGFLAYSSHNATLNLVLGGLALKASELKPVPFSKVTSPEILALREQQATVTQTRIRTDVTRYCYGQKAHFDRAMFALGLSKETDDDEIPQVEALREENINGAYALILEIYSPFVPFEAWQEKQDKMTKYFGPGVDVKITQVAEDYLEVAFIKTPE